MVWQTDGYLARTTPNIEDLIKSLEETKERISTKPHWPDCFQWCREGHVGTTSSSWWTRCFRSLQEEYATLLYVQDNFSTPFMLDSRTVRGICTWSKGSSSKNGKQCTEVPQAVWRTANDLKQNQSTKLQKALTISLRKEPQVGSQLYPPLKMGLPCTMGLQKCLCLRYGQRPSHLPSHCVCGQNFTIKHALSCSKGQVSFYSPQWDLKLHCRPAEWCLPQRWNAAKPTVCNLGAVWARDC